MRGKVFLLVGLLLAGVAAALGFAWPFGKKADVLKLPGVVEIQEIRPGPRVGGRVKSVSVMESDHAKAGRELVRLEIPELEPQLDCLRAKVAVAEAEWHKVKAGARAEEIVASQAAVDAARARWKRLDNGYRQEEIDQAAAEVRMTQADEQGAREEMDRAKRLRHQSAGSGTDYDARKATHEMARNRAAAAKAKHSLMVAGPRSEDKAEAKAELEKLEANHRLLVEGNRTEDKLAAEARVREAMARLAELEVTLKETVVLTPEDALVELVMVRPGDLVMPNQPVVKLLRTADLWVKTYVPETQLSRVHLGQTVTVTVDGFPNRHFDGRIVHIGGESEFTPRNVQSVDERRHQMFGIRIRISDPQGVFKSGMAAEVHIPLAQ